MSYEDPFNSDNVQIDVNTSNNFDDEDPAAEFLQREQQELGDITGNNGSINDNRNSLSNGAHSPMLNTGDSKSPTPSNESDSKYEALSQLNEPEKIRKWRDEFSTRINKKDHEEEIKRKEMHEQAKKELDDFYKQRIEQIERGKEQNRLNNRTLEDDLFKNGNNSTTTTNGKSNDWDKITSLCEFNPKNNRAQKDLTRFRSVLLQLKQQQTSAK